MALPPIKSLSVGYFYAKNAPYSYSFPLALISSAFADYDAVALLAFMTAFLAKGVVLPATVAAYEDAPFLFRLFR